MALPIVFGALGIKGIMAILGGAAAVGFTKAHLDKGKEAQVKLKIVKESLETDDGIVTIYMPELGITRPVKASVAELASILSAFMLGVSETYEYLVQKGEDEAATSFLSEALVAVRGNEEFQRLLQGILMREAALE